MTVGPVNTVTLVGDSAVLHCSAKGNPSNITYNWFKVSKLGARVRATEINSSRYVVTTTGSLRIDRVQIVDSGTYECAPSNAEGTGTTASANLTIASKKSS